MARDAIQTFTGKRFYPLAPIAADIEIADISHALAMQCRFTGHSREFYSVAQHSCLVRTLVQPWTPLNVLWALLHDAPEAYLVDVATPVKHAPEFAAYRHAEMLMQQAVAKRFSLPPVIPEAVHLADRTALAIEARSFMSPLLPEWEPYMTLDRREFTIVPLSWRRAEEVFHNALLDALDAYARVS